MPSQLTSSFSVTNWFLAHWQTLAVICATLAVGFVLSYFIKRLALRLSKKFGVNSAVGDVIVQATKWGIILLTIFVSAGIAAVELFSVPSEWFVTSCLTILRAILTLLIGSALIGIVLKATGKFLSASKIDPTLHPFIVSVLRVFLYIVLAIGCIDILGIPTASVIAAIGSVGLALSLSVKDHLSNLIGGLIVLITKPFSRGDYIEIDDCSGVVDEIGLIYTTLRTFDNKQIHGGGGGSAKAKITNHSSEPVRRLDMTFTIGYNDDYELARQLVLKTAQSTGLMLPDPSPVVRMNSHSASAIELICRLWVRYENYYELKFQMYEGVKRAFDENSINIPYQQMDVHIVS